MTARVEQNQKGKVRDDEISPRLLNLLSAVAEELDVYIDVTSGGQDSDHDPKTKGKTWTGSHRHDDGGAADVKVFKLEDGKKRYLDWSNADDEKIWEDVIRLSKAGGATGFGAGKSYMGTKTAHIGYGSEATWGSTGSGVPAADFVLRGVKAGRTTPPINIPDVASQTSTRPQPPAPMPARPFGSEAPAPLVPAAMPAAIAAGRDAYLLDVLRERALKTFAPPDLSLNPDLPPMPEPGHGIAQFNPHAMTPSLPAPGATDLPGMHGRGLTAHTRGKLLDTLAARAAAATGAAGTAALRGPAPVVETVPIEVAPVAPAPHPRPVAAGAGAVPAPESAPTLVRLPSGKLIAPGVYPANDGDHKLLITDDGQGNAIVKKQLNIGEVPGLVDPLNEGSNTLVGGIIGKEIAKATEQVAPAIAQTAENAAASLANTGEALKEKAGAIGSSLGSAFSGLGNMLSGFGGAPARPETGGRHEDLLDVGRKAAATVAPDIVRPASAQRGTDLRTAPVKETPAFQTIEMTTTNPAYTAYLKKQKADPIGSGAGLFADLQGLAGSGAKTKAPAPPPKTITVKKQVAVPASKRVNTVAPAPAPRAVRSVTTAAPIAAPQQRGGVAPTDSNGDRTDKWAGVLDQFGMIL